MSWMDDAMVTLKPWIGRVRTTEDDVGLMAMRRAAGTFDMDPETIRKGDELPPHWFTMFCAETPRQIRHRPGRPPQAGRGAAADPAAAPHGRRPAVVSIPGQLRIGDVGDQDGRGRRHRPEAGPHRLHHRADHAPHPPSRAERWCGGRVRRRSIREAVPPGTQKTTRAGAARRRTGAGLELTSTLSAPLLFRYSAVTWNAHRIHYDADYSRERGGLPGHGAEWRADHASAAGCGGGAHPGHGSPASPPG